jgi:CO dehydrogenase/acetyl-CoA synthase beta subunit
MPDMELFTDTIKELRSFVAQSSLINYWNADASDLWPAGGNRNIVLKDDTGLELGSPEMDSVSCLLWTHDNSLVEDGRITLIGRDFVQCTGESLPFGKVVIACVHGFNEDNAYERHKDMDFLRYDLDLKGFMLRAASQFMREWCRISKEAIRNGFSARILGSALIKLFRTQSFVKSTEVIYLTSSTDDIVRLKEITTPAEMIIAAMNKMAGEMDFECDSCDYKPVCDDATQLKSMRDNLIRKSKETVHA